MATRKPSSVKRTVALCYIRQSFTRNPSDMDSPERQRDNIARVCAAKGWTPEWYQDAEGHKSGTKIHNRPGWLALEKRLADPDVIAVIANDLARMHRKGWRIGQLVDLLEQHGLYLVLTAPGRELDLSKPQDRIAIQIIAMIDEWYAIDTRIRLEDSVRYRHRHGITVGMPPFGTWRDDDGYLVPSKGGVWVLPDGSVQAGTIDEDSPQAEAVWRSYYHCAVRILTLYAENKYGTQNIAVMMNAEGWWFRERLGNPRPITKDDIRRVISNWREYAGLVPGGRAKDKVSARLEEPLATIQETGRNVVDMNILRAVASVQAARSYKKSRLGLKKEVQQYALSGILYCAQCAQDAREKQNHRLNATITGHRHNRHALRYRHKAGHPCRAKNRSVLRDDLERDFFRLIQLLTVDESKIDNLLELRALSQRDEFRDTNDPDPEEEKRLAIAKCRKRIENARVLCVVGDMDTEDYLRIKEQNERDIAHWEARTSDIEQASLEFMLCVETIGRLASLWEMSSGEDRQGMVRMLFEYVEYDLDTRHITSFRLKPWADNYLVLRAALYETENPLGEGIKDKNIDGIGTKFQATTVPPEGIEPATFRLEGDRSIL